MDKKNVSHQAEAVDLVTGAMFSLSFLKEIQDVIFDPTKPDISVRDFYRQWHAATRTLDPKVPFSLGAFAGYLYAGLVITKEHWSDALPNVPAATAPSEWGLQGARIVAPKEPNPSLEYVVRRLRNAVGHGRIEPHVPPTATKQNALDVTTWKFHDTSRRDASDTFDAEVSMANLTKLVKQFQAVAHKHVRTQTGRP